MTMTEIDIIGFRSDVNMTACTVNLSRPNMRSRLTNFCFWWKITKFKKIIKLQYNLPVSNCFLNRKNDHNVSQ